MQLNSFTLDDGRTVGRCIFVYIFQFYTSKKKTESRIEEKKTPILMIIYE